MSGFPLLMAIFSIYAILGWCMEVCYAAIDDGKFVNRGFLNGPVCPIYGCGALLVISCLQPINDNLFLLFIGSVVLTTLLELVTGWILERVFNQKWWDYSKQHFQFRGYICLKFSIIWGLACVLLMRVIHPLVIKFINWLAKPIMAIWLFVFFVLFICDLVLTVIALMKIKRRYKLLTEMDELLNKISNNIGEKLYEGTMIGIQGVENSKGKLEESKEKLNESFEKTNQKLDAIGTKMEDKREDLTKRFEEMSNRYKSEFASIKHSRIHTRISKAFPDIKFPNFKTTLERFNNLQSHNKSDSKTNDDSANNDSTDNSSTDKTN